MFYNMLIIIDIIFQGRGVIAPKSLTPLSSKSMGRQPIAVSDISVYQARARCVLRALGLLLADGTPTVGGGKTFWAVSQFFFTETAVTPERKVEKSFPRWEINRHAKG